MNRKGFTLIEMLGCMLIMAIILGIGLYSARGTLATSLSTLTNISENEIYSASKIYVLENGVNWINDGTEYTCITIDNLVEKGYFDEDEVLSYKDEIIKIERDKEQPTQKDTLRKSIKTIMGTEIEINYIALYKMSGRVIDVQNYLGYTAQNVLSPKDIGIAWGFMANEENIQKVKWNSYGNRWLYWNIEDQEWLKSVGGMKKVDSYFSNNHLIPSDDKIEKLIKNIKVDDYIKINGYLVSVNYSNKYGVDFIWNSSTSRYDDGAVACEVIYVTNITWLEEKNYSNSIYYEIDVI